MNQITINQQPVRAVTLTDGSIAAVAKDVALAVGFKHTTSAVSKYCLDPVAIQDLTTTKPHTIGRGAKMIYEEDIYRLIRASTAPDAGVSFDIGLDVVEVPVESSEELVQRDPPNTSAQLGADIIACMMEVAERFVPYNPNALYIAAQEATRLTGIAWDELVSAPRTWCSASQMGEMFNLSSTEVNARLEALGMQVRKGLSWEPTPEYRTWCRRKTGAFCLEWDCDKLELVFEAEVQE